MDVDDWSLRFGKMSRCRVSAVAPLLTGASKVWACGKRVSQLTAQLDIAVNPRAPSSKGFLSV